QNLIVHAIRGVERLSQAFSYEVDFSADALDLDATLGSPCLVHLTDPAGHERFISGVVQRLSALAHLAETTRYPSTLGPRPYLLSYRHGCRIFQELAIPEVVKKVFADVQLKSADSQWDLRDSYPKRAFCVQYDETEWNFVNRLLEESGIHYFFEHDATGHRMVFRDASPSAAPAEPAEIPFRFDRSLHGDELRAWDLGACERTCISKVAINDYDMLKPSLPLAANESVQDSAIPAQEWYEYPGLYEQPSEGKRLARVRLQELRGERTTVRVHTNA